MALLHKFQLVVVVVVDTIVGIVVVVQPHTQQVGRKVLVDRMVGQHK